MSRSSIFTIVFLASTTSLISQHLSDKQLLNLNGPIRARDTYVADCEFKNGRVSQGPSTRTAHRAFDTKGNLTEYTTYYTDGSVQYRYMFSESGSVQRWKYFDGKTLLGEGIQTRDSAGRTLSYEFRDTRRILTGKTVVKIDTLTRSREVSHYDDNGSLTSHEVIAYDENDREIARRFFGTFSSSEDSSRTYAYDEHGFVTRVSYFRFSKSPEYVRTFVNDTVGRTLVETVARQYRDPDSTFSTYEVDKHGNVTKETLSKRVERFGVTNMEPFRVVVYKYTYY